MPEDVLQVFNSLSDVEKQEAMDFMNFLRTRPRAMSDAEKILKKPKRQLDTWKGRIKMSTDFDETPDCFKEYM